jgi:hypothetical protein
MDWDQIQAVGLRLKILHRSWARRPVTVRRKRIFEIAFIPFELDSQAGFLVALI